MADQRPLWNRCGQQRRVANLLRGLALVGATLLGTSSTAFAQQSLTEVLSFLLTNRSIATGDFAGDVQAAAATRDALTTYLLTELGTLPVSSSATGFTYRADPALGGVPVRSSLGFGPFFTERTLTAGARQVSFGAAFWHASFDRIDGRQLGDGTLIATATRLGSDSAPFDVEALTLRLRANTVTTAVNVGLTDRLDIGAALPFVDLRMDGQRVDTYRGSAVIQATASASASGIGDLVWRAKYNAVRQRASGLAVFAQGRLPTGSTEDLLGAGRTTFEPRLIGSVEGERVALNAELGYVFGSHSPEIDYGVAITAVAHSRVTVVGEMIGRRLTEAGRLTDVVAPHPSLSNVETIRLTAVDAPTDRIMVVSGVKWNVGAAWLASVNVAHFLGDAGLTGGWTPVVSAEYAFGR